MSDIEIYFEEDSELTEYESLSRGYRTDVYVKIRTSVFNVRVYSMIRLQQDFESEILGYGYYAIEPNLILVSEAKKDTIIATIKKLYEQKYFNEIKTIDSIDVNRLVQVQ